MKPQTNRQNLPNPGVLYVVSTPIGNLKDMTERAKSTLETVNVILCEDTRVTQKLLRAYRLSTRAKLIRFDEKASYQNEKKVLALLEKGEKIALVSDAGTPVINDPGRGLVGAVREAGFSVIPVPGVSAVSTFLSVCGLSFQSFTFRGYFPRAKSDQKKELDSFFEDPFSEVWIWFESPRRIKNTLNLLKKETPKSKVAIGKEMTKAFESYFCGTLGQLDLDFQDQGEFCFALQKERSGQKIKKKLNAKSLLLDLIPFEIPASALAKILARHTSEKRQMLYEEIKKMRKKC